MEQNSLFDQVYERMCKAEEAENYRLALEMLDWHNKETAKNVDTTYSQSPDYYKVVGVDLYEVFLEKYGADKLLAHLEMECIQYLWRCRDKQQYGSNIAKVNNITKRMLKITGTNEKGDSSANTKMG